MDAQTQPRQPPSQMMTLKTTPDLVPFVPLRAFIIVAAKTSFRGFRINVAITSRRNPSKPINAKISNYVFQKVLTAVEMATFLVALLPVIAVKTLPIASQIWI